LENLFLVNMRASVIIPALNEAVNLARSLPIVAEQVGSDGEIVVVDNGSTDQTAAVARSFRCRVVQETVRSRPRARNAGIRHTTGEILLFLDADCMPKENWFRRMIGAFDDPTVGGAAGEIQTAESQSPLDRFLKSRGYLSQAVSFKHPFLPYGNTANVAYRRSCLAAIGGFDQALPEGEDADLSWKMQLQTDLRLIMVPEAVVVHEGELKPLEFLRQKRRHAYGAVLLYKKYRRYRPNENFSSKKLYWEYSSILRRGVRFLLREGAAAMKLGPKPSDDEAYQLLIEIGDKLGRVEGAIKHRVWYL